MEGGEYAFPGCPTDMLPRMMYYISPSRYPQLGGSLLWKVMAGHTTSPLTEWTRRGTCNTYVLFIVTDGDGTCGRRGLGEVFRDAFKKSHEPGYADTRGVRSC